MDAVLTLEAARENGDIVTSRKAGKWVQIEVFGKSAHAGVEPEKGASATLALAHIIARIFALNAMKPGMTVNPGEISGGSRPNVVADYARVELDVRAWSNSDLDELISAIRRVARQGYVPGTTVEVTIDPNSGSPAMEYTEGTRRLETASLEIAEELGFSLKGASTGGGSDVSFACHAGTPGLDGLGPIGGLDHSPDEYLLISSIVPRTALLAKLLQRIGDGDGFDYAERAGCRRGAAAPPAGRSDRAFLDHVHGLQRGAIRENHPAVRIQERGAGRSGLRQSESRYGHPRLPATNRDLAGRFR
jgi:glutamate carboxypeptidase